MINERPEPELRHDIDCECGGDHVVAHVTEATAAMLHASSNLTQALAELYHYFLVRDWTFEATLTEVEELAEQYPEFFTEGVEFVKFAIGQEKRAMEMLSSEAEDALRQAAGETE